MAPIKNTILLSGLLLCMSSLAHAGGLPAQQAATTETADSQQDPAAQTQAGQAPQTAPAQTQQSATTTNPSATPAAAGQAAQTASGQAPAAGQAPSAPVPTTAAPGTPPGTVAPVPGVPAAPAPAGTAPGTMPPGTAAPGTTTADGAYVPRTQYDNTPHRFNMTQEGKRMSADDFDAWMRAKGYRVATGRPPADCPNVPPAGVETIVGPDGCPVEVSIDLEGVTFEFGKTALRAEAKKTLDQAIEILKRHPELTVEVAGHTDSRGSADVNQKVSESRAKAVYDYLVEHGIAASQLEGPIGYGENKPIAPNETDAGREKNRRTELNIKASAAPAVAPAGAASAAPGAAGAATADLAAGAAAAAAAGAATGQPAATGAQAGQQVDAKPEAAKPEADATEAEAKPEPEKTPR